MLAAIILAVANLYCFLYTIYLKPRTPQNIVIGGAAGAFPPMIGWAMATGELSWVSFALFLFVFTWTPPHSWALALYKRDDYAAAGFPMLPVVAAKQKQSARSSFTVLRWWPCPWFLGSCQGEPAGFTGLLPLPSVSSLLLALFAWHALPQAIMTQRKSCSGLASYIWRLCSPLPRWTQKLLFDLFDR